MIRLILVTLTVMLSACGKSGGGSGGGSGTTPSPSPEAKPRARKNLDSIRRELDLIESKIRAYELSHKA